MEHLKERNPSNPQFLASRNKKPFLHPFQRILDADAEMQKGVYKDRCISLAKPHKHLYPFLQQINCCNFRFIMTYLLLMNTNFFTFGMDYYSDVTKKSSERVHRK